MLFGVQCCALYLQNSLLLILSMIQSFFHSFQSASNQWVCVFINSPNIKTKLARSTIQQFWFFILRLPKSRRLNIVASTLSYCRQSFDFVQFSCGLEVNCIPSYNVNFLLFQVCFLKFPLYIIVLTSRWVLVQLYHILTVTAAVDCRHCMCTHSRSSLIPSTRIHSCFSLRGYIAAKDVCTAEKGCRQKSALNLFLAF